jgi:Tol biopolymer transport system component
MLDQPRNRLLLMSPDGGEAPRALTPPEMMAKRPEWLSTGHEIAFNREDRGIWTLALRTGHVAPFLPEQPPDGWSYFHPCAYPRERAVVVVAFREAANGREGVLFKLAPDASPTQVPLTTFPEVCAGRPGVGPKGATVVFAGNAGRFAQGANQLWIVSPGERTRRLEAGELHLVQGRSPRWSPDGRWIACTSTRPHPRPDEKTPRAIWIVRADGGEAHRLTDRAFTPLHVAWSPDQRRLACGGFGCGLGVVDLPEIFHRAQVDPGPGPFP